MNGLDFAWLGADDLPELLDLLQRVWPQQYGATGCPAFSLEYLRWLYGGPEADRHLVAGLRLGGRLVGAKGALYRQTRGPGEARSASWVSTHLTVAPELDFGQRMAAAGELSKLYTLDQPVPPGEANYLISYYEDAKSLSRNRIRQAQKDGLACAETRFRQAILNPRQAKAAAAAAGPVDLQPATDDDWPALAARGTGADALVWTPSAERLRHHSAAAPAGETLVARRDGAICGSMMTYVLDWLRDGNVTRMLVVERVEADEDDILAHLLSSAADRAGALGLRGTVIENPTLLPQSARRMGVVPTARVMVAVCRSRDPLPATERFVLDIK